MDRYLSNMVSKRLTSISQTATYEPFTPWLPAVGVDAVRALLIARDMLGEFDWQFAMQTAAVDPARPDAWSALGSAQTTAIPYCTGNTSVSGTLATKMWVRFGVKYMRHDASPTYAQADLMVQPSLIARGSIVSTMPATTVSAISTTIYQTLWTTDWVPAELVDKVRAGIWIGNITGTPSVQLVYQKAVARTSLPGAWITLPGASVYTTVNDFNTGELPTSGTPFADSMWVRFGIQYKSSTVGYDATIGAVVGIRRS